MWHAWDLALDLCLAQLPGVLDTERPRPFQHSAFFQEQLTAFQVWLHLGSEARAPPEQLPVVLQVCLLYLPVFLLLGTLVLKFFFVGFAVTSSSFTSFRTSWPIP